MIPSLFIPLMLPGAQASFAATQVPVGFTIAQAATESGWLSKPAPGNALFGIKATPDWQGATTSFATHEDYDGRWVEITAVFRAYPDYAACLLDHGNFLRQNPRYANCFTTTDAKEFARRVAAAGYATDPNYAQTICAIIDAHALTQYDIKTA